MSLKRPRQPEPQKEPQGKKLCTGEKEEKKAPPTYLANKYPHTRDKYITFDEEPHIYDVDHSQTGKEFSSKNIISITTFIKEGRFSKFEADIVIRQNYDKWQRDPHNKYYGKSKDEIKKMWDMANKLGTIMHRTIEYWYNLMPPTTPHTVEFTQFLECAKVLKGQGWEAFRTEWMLWTPQEFSLAGAIDFLMRQSGSKAITFDETTGIRTLHLRMIDFKRTVRIMRSNRFRKGTGLCEELDDCNFIHYSLQLNFYKYIIEMFYRNIMVDNVLCHRIQIDDMFLLCMHPTERTSYELIEVSNSFRPLVIKLLEERRLSLVKSTL